MPELELPSGFMETGRLTIVKGLSAEGDTRVLQYTEGVAHWEEAGLLLQRLDDIRNSKDWNTSL